MENRKMMYVPNARPKKFLGAVLGVAQLGMSIAGMISQNKAQKAAIKKQNEDVARQNAIAFGQRLETDTASARSYGSDAPLDSFYSTGGNYASRRSIGVYANGGNSTVKPVAEDLSVAFGATHNEQNPQGDGTGVPYKGAEVEGGGKDGNQAGEVIKHEQGGNDFIFSDRIPISGNTSFAEVAQQLSSQKASLEKSLGAILVDNDNIKETIAKSGSYVQASNDMRKITRNTIKINKLEESKSAIDSKLEQLKQAQLQKGMEMGLYNEDGTPVEDQEVPSDGQMAEPKMAIGGNLETRQKFNNGTPPVNVEEKPNIFITADGTQVDLNKYNGVQRFGMKADKFLSSPEGYGVIGLANAGINYISNLNTAKNMANLKTPDYIPIKALDTSRVNFSADRQAIKEGVKSVEQYAEDNFANPQVALAVKQNAIAKGISSESQINQREQTANTEIENQNIQRRLSVDAQNNEGVRQKQTMDYQKAMQDINNSSNVTGALTKDLQDTMRGVQEGYREEKQLKLYERLYAKGVSERTNLAMNGIDLDGKSPQEIATILKNNDYSDDEIIKILKARDANAKTYKAGFSSTPAPLGNSYLDFKTTKGYSNNSIVGDYTSGIRNIGRNKIQNR